MEYVSSLPKMTEVEPGFRPWLTILFQEAPACLQGAGFVCFRV